MPTGGDITWDIVSALLSRALRERPVASSVMSALAFPAKWVTVPPALPNFWKSFVQARFAVAMGDPGSLSLFGQRPEHHRLVAEHLTSEFRVRTQGCGRTVDEWKLKVDGLDNHWLDCLVGSAVAASMEGASLFGAEVQPARKTPIRLSELRRARK